MTKDLTPAQNKALDRDEDGDAGGSKPKVKTVAPPEKSADELAAEAAAAREHSEGA